MAAVSDAAVQGVVFNIQKYSVHDGPGIRSLVFVKGCPLVCRWCSNPESQRREPELAFNKGRCLTMDKCSFCSKAGQAGALRRGDGGLPRIDGSRSGADALRQAEACPPRALLVYGKVMTVRETIEDVERDAVFYNRSDGGLTVSGGEPLFQPEFTLALLREAKKHRLHTTMETTGFAAWSVLEEAARHLDAVLFDIKHLDPACHKQGTAVDNARILENFRALARKFPDKDITVRVPVIPNFNDNEGDIEAIAAFAAAARADNGAIRLELLPYHRLGTQKYAFLGREYPMGDVSLDTSKMDALTAAARRHVPVV